MPYIQPSPHLFTQSFWQGSPATNSASCASSGFYQSRRSSDKTYLEYGAEMVTKTIVPFIVGLQQHSVYSDTIVGLELINISLLVVYEKPV